MAISINWPTGEIFIPKIDTELVQVAPTEIRSLDLDWFRRELKSLEDRSDGMGFLKTHNHNTEVFLGGLTFARVITILEPYTVTFEDGQYSVDLLKANSNVGDRINPNQVGVRSYNSAGLISNSAIEYASFNGGVIIDTDSPYSGTLFPVGTEQKKVNNIEDAILIAKYRGFSKLYLHSDITIGNNINISNFLIQGQSHVHTHVYMEDTANCSNVTLENLDISGILDGGTTIRDCSVGDINYVNGEIINCGLYGTVILDGNKNAVITDCHTINQDMVPVIDMNESGQSLAMPGYSGVLIIENLSDPTNEIGIGLDHGMIVLSDTITEGLVVIAGTGIVQDNTGDNVIVNIDALINKTNISDAVLNTSLIPYIEKDTVAASLRGTSFGGSVHINATSGTAGTVYPLGTLESPTSNLADAVIIATGLGLSTIRIHGNYHFPNGTYVANWKIVGDGKQKSIFTFDIGSIVAYCQFEDCKMSGFLTGVTGFRNCHILNLGSVGLVPSSNTVVVQDCLLEGSLTLPDNYSGQMNVIDSWMVSTDGEPVTVDMGSCTANMQISNLSGLIKIVNCTEEIDIGISLSAGGITLDSSCTAGNFIFSGTGTLEDNSTSVISLSVSGLMSKETISSAVLSTDITEYAEVGTVGATFVSGAYGGQVYIDTATANAGQNYPIGTKDSPVNNLTDAMAIVDKYGLNTLHLHSDLTITAGTDIASMIVEAHGSYEHTITLESGVLIHDTIFDRCKLTGVFGDKATFTNCYLVNATYISGNFSRCIFGGTIVMLPDSTLNQFNDCQSASGQVPVTFVLGNADTTNTEWKGLLAIAGKTGTADTTFQADLGIFIIDVSCTEGTILLSGRARVMDYSSGECDVQTDYVYDSNSQAEKVWDVLLSDHDVVGSAGKILNTINIAGGTDPDAIAEAVWSIVAADNNITGSMGAVMTILQNKLNTISQKIDSQDLQYDLFNNKLDDTQALIVGT